MHATLPSKAITSCLKKKKKKKKSVGKGSRYARVGCIAITRLIISDSKCCGPKKPKRANRQCHFDPNCILVLGEVLKVSWLYS